MSGEVGRPRRDNDHGGVPEGRSERRENDESVIDRSPARLSVGLGIGFALLVVVLLPTVVAALLAVPGAALLGVGALRGDHRHVSYGTAGLLLATTVAAAGNARAPVVMVAALLSLLAWDLARYGITIGEQLGREADTARVEIAHAALTASAGFAGGTIAYAAYLLVPGVPALLALGLLLFGGVVILTTLG